MKTKRLSVILFAMLLPFTSWADVWQDPETKVNYEYTVGSNEASVKAGVGGVAGSPDVNGNIAILSKIFINGKEYTVTRIEYRAFVHCHDLTSVNIPNSVTIIGDEAFIGCHGLTSITIPNSVTSIGHDAFNNCTSLTSVTIPSSVTSIEIGVFYRCTSLTSVAIPNSVISIGGSAFLNCSSLTSVTIPNSVTTIGDGAFYGCTSLTSVTIPNSVTSIGNQSFLFCTSLTSIEVNSENTSYDSREDCNAIIETGSNTLITGCLNTSIPNSVTSIGDYAFQRCSGLTSVTIPNSVTSIGRAAFKDCSGLTSVTIPSSVTSIGRAAFSNCSGLTSATIPNSVTSIDFGVFRNCSGLTSLNIPNSVTIIGSSAFSGCSGLTSVIIGNSVTSIGNNAFSGCSSLTSVTIPNSVTSIGESAFENCSSLEKVNFNATNCTSMGSSNNRVFTGCSSLATLIIGDDVQNIPAYAFYYCSGLTSLDIPNSVTCIGEDAFCGCSGLTSLDIPNSVTCIGEKAFSHCSGLTSLDIPNSVTSIGKSAFSDCSGLTSVTIPNSVTSIGYWAFSYCSSLEEVYFNATNCTSMGHSFFPVFSGCSSLATLKIGDNVQNIPAYAFYSCSGLTSLDIPNSVTRIGYYAFSGCSGLTSVMSLIENPFPIDSSVFDDSTYDTATLYVPVGSLDAYITTYGWENFANIVDIAVSTLTLTVNDESGSDITKEVSIAWYDSNGKEIGNGNSLNGIVDGTELYYSVTLGEELGRVYREVMMRKVVAIGEPLTCQLEKIGRVTLEGRVSATDIDKNTMTVNVEQMLNGKYPQNYTTLTNEQGVFRVEVYDDETDITISGNGYLDATLHRNGFNGSGNVGTIPVSLITGFAIAANITMQVAGDASEHSITTWTDALANIDFALTNKGNGASITDFTVQNGSVIIKTGAKLGDEVSLVARSKQGIFADAATTFKIEEDANSFELLLTELGGVDATCAASSNGSTVGYLYDGNGLLAAKGSYVGETLSLRHLKSGAYTLVSMGNSLLLGSMTQLADIDAIGLKEGTDYVASSVTVTDGELTAVSVSEVPRLDEAQFYYTNNETYFSANKPSVTAGNYLTLQAHVGFKPEYASMADGVTLTIDLPEGCEMVENSVIANHAAVPHTVSGNRVTMTLSEEQYGSQVRFCIIPTLNQNYSVTAMARFDINGEVTQPIGTAQFEAKGLSLSAPKYAASTTITINGTAKAHSEVSIYDNDVLIGKASSKADGSWTALCELYKPYSHSFHEIYAKITTENGMELTSETRQVEYDKNHLVPSSVMMTYYNGWYKKNIDVEFDLLNGTTSPSSYPFYQGTDFTFLADFTRNDSTAVKNVNIKVLNSDGTVRTLPATFDGKQGKWVATTKYTSSSRLPQNVTVEYDLLPLDISDEEREEALQEQANVLAFTASVIGSFFDEKTEMILAEEGEDYALFECRTSQDLAPMYYRIENIDYQVADDMMKNKQFVYTESEDNIIGTYTESTDGGVTVYVVDVLNNAACKMSLYENTVVGARAKAHKKEVIKKTVQALQESVGSGRFLDGFLEHFGNLVDLLTGIKEYWRVKGDFDNMCNIILNYSDNLEQINKATFDMTLAKCPDGSYRLSKENMEKFYKAIQATADAESAFMEQYYLCLEEYKAKLGLSVMTYVGTLGLGKAIGALGKSSKFVNSPMNMWVYNNLNKHFSSYVFRTTSASILSSVIGTAVGWVLDKLDEIFSYKDFNGVKDRTLSWASTEYSGYLKNYADLKKAIRRDYKKCGKDDDEKQDEPLDNNSGNNPDFLGKGTTPVIDPSGYVYEAVLSNRLEGVTTTCYEQQGGSTLLWNAEDYSQQNPLKTDATGFYRWDVPQGMWQVKYEKEGYEAAFSEWLPVPPPQLDVNIGMKQSTPPTVTQMRGYESGITIDMSKYMLPATMNAANITVTRNSTAESGSIELLNAEQAPLGGETYVQKVKFVPQSRFNTTDQVVVTVHQKVESYCGTKMTKDHVETVKIEPEIKSIVADSIVTVPYQGERELRVLVVPKDASAGKTLHARTSSAMIASVSAADVTIGQDGAATLTLGGELPGGAVVDFSVDGSDVTATSKVRVVIGREQVAMPTSNIVSGTTIEGGTQIVLTCATEGATIYYTLDGSCPCDEATRHRYEGPITIATDVIVKAIAVKEGLDDSDIATFAYMVNGIGGVKSSFNIVATFSDGKLTIGGAEGCTVRVYDLLGHELAYSQRAPRRIELRVPKAEGYIVAATTADGKTVVRKVVGQ